jgi:hypothetical protein
MISRPRGFPRSSLVCRRFAESATTSRSRSSRSVGSGMSSTERAEQTRLGSSAVVAAPVVVPPEEDPPAVEPPLRRVGVG